MNPIVLLIRAAPLVQRETDTIGFIFNDIEIASLRLHMATPFFHRFDPDLGNMHIICACSRKISSTFRGR